MINWDKITNNDIITAVKQGGLAADFYLLLECGRENLINMIANKNPAWFKANGANMELLSNSDLANFLGLQLKAGFIKLEKGQQFFAQNPTARGKEFKEILEQNNLF